MTAYGVIGLIVGARLGYCLFYNFGFYFSHPLKCLAIWEGGMSFHGGLIGLVLGGWLFSRRKNKSLLMLADMGAQVIRVERKAAARRPLSLVRIPHGSRPFFQKHDTGGFPDAMKRVTIKLKESERQDHFYVEDLAGILSGDRTPGLARSVSFTCLYGFVHDSGLFVLGFHKRLSLTQLGCL